MNFPNLDSAHSFILSRCPLTCYLPKCHPVRCHFTFPEILPPVTLSLLPIVFSSYHFLPLGYYIYISFIFVSPLESTLWKQDFAYFVHCCIPAPRITSFNICYLLLTLYNFWMMMLWILSNWIFLRVIWGVNITISVLELEKPQSSDKLKGMLKVKHLVIGIILWQVDLITEVH